MTEDTADMDGKVVLITGASSGIGFAAARRLAEVGGEVVMICRDPSRGDAARNDVARVATGPAPTLLLADLTSQESIRSLAMGIHSNMGRIDVLVNNAGAVFARRELTIDGIEKTLAVNYLAPFLLTHLLLDLLNEAPAGRVVTVASETHSDKLDFGNLQGEKEYNFLSAYNRSKLADILFTYELARRLEGTAVTANCLSPGPTKTRFGDNLSGLPRLFPILMKRIPFLFVDPAKGARTLTYVASSPQLTGVSGKFFLRGRERLTKPVTYDPKIAAELWSVSERLTKITQPQVISQRQHD
jgi:NAD(P)-dependent dehydrogenase (short-subunit alcohol dehydrogenase family)